MYIEFMESIWNENNAIVDNIIEDDVIPSYIGDIQGW
jgi:hypothetical protein